MERRSSMIVNRRTFLVKKGCSGKVVELLKTVSEGFNQLKAVRIYESYISPSDQVTWEAEFENLEEYAKFSAAWTGDPKRAAILEKFVSLTESGGTSEIWRLV
jgi:hypothetical protein